MPSEIKNNEQLSTLSFLVCVCIYVCDAGSLDVGIVDYLTPDWAHHLKAFRS